MIDRIVVTNLLQRLDDGLHIVPRKEAIEKERRITPILPINISQLIVNGHALGNPLPHSRPEPLAAVVDPAAADVEVRRVQGAATDPVVVALEVLLAVLGEAGLGLGWGSRVGCLLRPQICGEVECAGVSDDDKGGCGNLDGGVLGHWFAFVLDSGLRGNMALSSRGVDSGGWGPRACRHGRGSGRFGRRGFEGGCNRGPRSSRRRDPRYTHRRGLEYNARRRHKHVPR